MNYLKSVRVNFGCLWTMVISTLRSKQMNKQTYNKRFISDSSMKKIKQEDHKG